MLVTSILNAANPDSSAGFSFEQGPPVVRFALPRAADNTSDAAHCETLAAGRLVNTRNSLPMLVTRLPTFRKRGPDRRPSKPAPHRPSTSGRLFAKRARVCARRQGPAIVPDTSPRRVGVAAGSSRTPIIHAETQQW